MTQMSTKKEILGKAWRMYLQTGHQDQIWKSRWTVIPATPDTFITLSAHWSPVSNIDHLSPSTGEKAEAESSAFLLSFKILVLV